MSQKPQVRVAGEGDKWHSNGLCFATEKEKEAADNARGLFGRWTLAVGHPAASSRRCAGARRISRVRAQDRPVVA
jgi:hypothetical protein